MTTTTISDGLGDTLWISDEPHGRLTVNISGGTGFVALDGAGEAKLLDYLTARANAKRDAQLRAMHTRRYYAQGPEVRRDLPPATALEDAS